MRMTPRNTAMVPHPTPFQPARALQSWKAAYVTLRTQAQQEASMGQTHISS